MNVIVSNQQNDLLSSLQIDVIKKVEGEYTADEIVSMFENFFYQRLILDITAIKDYKDVKNIQNLSINLDADKLVLLLDNCPETSSREYISKLISVGIYNFTRNQEGLMYLLEHPNTYKDVANLHELDDKVTVMTRIENSRTRVLGIKNVTEHAGSTSLIYMLKKELSNNYTVMAVEIDKRDFAFFNEKGMISTTSDDLGKELLNISGKADIVLIDLNNSNQDKVCNDILYLIEPSTIKLNKLIARNKQVLAKLEGKKVILNKSLLSQRDISEFEMESGIRIFYSIPPLNDREKNIDLKKFLVKLGLLKENVEGGPMQTKSKLFDIFKRKS